MLIFSRTISHIRQEPSVQFWIIVWEMLRAGDKTFRTQLVWWKPRATQEGLKCILKLQSWYCRVTYRNMGYYKKLQTNMCYKMSFFSKDIMTCMLSNKTCYCSGLYGLFLDSSDSLLCQVLAANLMAHEWHKPNNQYIFAKLVWSVWRVTDRNCPSYCCGCWNRRTWCCYQMHFEIWLYVILRVVV